MAVSGDTVVVGANGEDSSTTGTSSTPNESASGAGAAYVFVRSGMTWSQQAYLKASQVTSGDQFGWSVAVSGDTVVVGAWLEDSSSTGINATPDETAADAGAAYLFMGLGPQPDIAVAQAGPVTEGGRVDFGPVAAGGSQTLTFTVTNPGSFELNNLAITKDGANPVDFIVSALSGSSVPVGGGNVTFTVTFVPTAGGVRSAALHVASNVTGDKNPFDFTLTGTAVPVALALNPSHGPSTGGTEVTISGAGFTGTPTVTFGGQVAPVLNATDTELTVTSPPYASGAVPVVVSAGPLVSNPLTYTYDALPTLTGINPDHGPSTGGNVVQLTGTDLAGVSSVTFGGVPAVSFTPSPSGVLVTVPPHASGPVSVVVTAGPVVSNPLTYNYENSTPLAGPDSLNRPNTTTVAKVLKATLLANDTDADLDPLSLTAVGNPTQAGPGTATVAIVGNFVVYTASANDAGNGSFDYTLSDGTHTVTGTVTVTETTTSGGGGGTPNYLTLV